MSSSEQDFENDSDAGIASIAKLVAEQLVGRGGGGGSEEDEDEWPSVEEVKAASGTRSVESRSVRAEDARRKAFNAEYTDRHSFTWCLTRLLSLKMARERLARFLRKTLLFDQTGPLTPLASFHGSHSIDIR